MKAPAQVLRHQTETTSLMDALDKVLPTRLLQLRLGWHIPWTSLILPMPPMLLQATGFLHAPLMNQHTIHCSQGKLCFSTPRIANESKATSLLADNFKGF